MARLPNPPRSEPGCCLLLVAVLALLGLGVAR